MNKKEMLKTIRNLSCKICLGILVIALSGSCRHKQKPESKDYTRVKLTESGHRDSMIDNNQRLYNASIPDACLQCIIDAVRNTDQLKKYLNSADSSKIIYEVDWSSGPKLKDSLKNAGSGMIIHVIKKIQIKKDTLDVFTFNNVMGQLYFINDQNGSHQELVKLDSVTRLKIRNACFWGVASGK